MAVNCPAIVHKSAIFGNSSYLGSTSTIGSKENKTLPLVLVITYRNFPSSVFSTPECNPYKIESPKVQRLAESSTA